MHFRLRLPRPAHTAPILFALAAALGCSSEAIDPVVPTCTTEQGDFAEGETFSVDCNTCTCQADGSTNCTTIACVDTCTFEGATYEVGDTFERDCNTCSCEADGNVACTLRGCVETCTLGDETYLVGDTFSDGCNTCTCTEGGIACTQRACLQECGGIQGLSCDEGQFCDFPIEATCGAADQLGTCRDLPDVCTTDESPVCGCDDETYDNECRAAAAGVSVAATGACAAECSDTNPCLQPACPCLDENGDGVCENDCPSFVCDAGRCVVQASTGTLGLGDSCGGFTPPDAPTCGAGLFCQHQPGALCGAADAPGECVVAPDACIEIYNPVCGCDGVTYSSACHAALDQMGILANGECEQ